MEKNTSISDVIITLDLKERKIAQYGSKKIEPYKRYQSYYNPNLKALEPVTLRCCFKITNNCMFYLNQNKRAFLI
jgi:hypothetical protein